MKAAITSAVLFGTLVGFLLGILGMWSTTDRTVPVEIAAAYPEGFQFSVPCVTHGSHVMTVVDSAPTRIYNLVDDLGRPQMALESDIEFAVMMQDAFIVAPVPGAEEDK